MKAEPAASPRSWRNVAWSAGLDRSRRNQGTSGECLLSDLSTATHTNPSSPRLADSRAQPHMS
eukprot:7612568-Heterocapsa_arctica.AAC.1